MRASKLEKLQSPSLETAVPPPAQCFGTEVAHETQPRTERSSWIVCSSSQWVQNFNRGLLSLWNCYLLCFIPQWKLN